MVFTLLTAVADIYLSSVASVLCRHIHAMLLAHDILPPACKTVIVLTFLGGLKQAKKAFEAVLKKERIFFI